MSRDNRAVIEAVIENDRMLNVPPHAIEAEQSVIGGLMLDPRAWPERIEDSGLQAKHFYRRDHQLIFAAIRTLAEADSPFDIVTLGEQLEREGHLKRIGGMPYLGELARNIPSTANIFAYAKVIQERALLRDIMAVGREAVRLACERRDPAPSADEVLNEVEQHLFALGEAATSRDCSNLKATLDAVLHEIDERCESGNPLFGLNTGLRDLNTLTGGLQAGSLVVVGARPAMGKTSLALQFALSALALNTPADPAQSAAPSVQFFSLEMPDKQIVLRCLAQLGQVNAQRLQSGQLHDDDWQRLTFAVQRFNDLCCPHFALNDGESLTPSLLRSKARRAARRFGLPKLIVIDYLQLMHIEGKKENRNLELSEITRALKGLAKEMNCPVVLLSQLGRDCEKRASKRPLPSDLRDSGAIEQDADLILLLYRDEVYHEDSDDQGLAEILVSKNRNGPTGSIKAAWIAEQSRFADLSQHYGENHPQKEEPHP